MPTPEAQKALSDPAFLALPEGERVKVLEALDPEFRVLPQPEKLRVFALPGERPVYTPSGELPDLPGTIEERRAQGTQLLPMVGGLAGGLMGGIPGAALGGILGVRGKQKAQEWLGMVPPPADDAARKAQAEEAAMGGIVEGATQGVGGLVGRGLGRLFHPRTLSPESQVVQEINERLGLGLPADAVVGSGALGSMRKTLGETSIAGRGVAERAKGITTGKLQTAQEGNLALVAPPSTPTAAGEQAIEAARVGSKVAHAEGNRLYRSIEGEIDLSDISKRIPGGFSPTLDAAKRKAKEAAAKEANSIAEGIRQRYGGSEESQKRILAALGISEEPAEVVLRVPFKEAQAIRAELRKVPRNELMRTWDEAQHGDAVSKITDQIRADLTPEMRAQFEAARGFWRDEVNRTFGKGGAEEGRRSLGARMVQQEQHPQRVTSLVEPLNVKSVKDARKALKTYTERFGSPEESAAGAEAWDSFRRQWVQDRLLKTPEALLPGKIPSLKDNLEKAGDDVLREMFSDPRGRVFLRNLRSIGEAMERVDKLPTHRGIYIHQAIVAGLAGGALGMGSGTGPAAGLVATAEIVPYLMTRIAYSPRFTRLLLNGISQSVKTGSEQAVANTVRGIRAALEDDTLSPPLGS